MVQVTFSARTLTPEDFRTYRQARYGDAGRCGQGGVAKAAMRHGVAIRTWFTYERGTRKPNAIVRRDVARWLNRVARRQMVEAAGDTNNTARSALQT